MNRGRISTQVFLCFFVMMFLMVIGCGKSDDTLPTYNISGAVTGATVAGVTINLTGAATATTTTDASGNYSFTGQANGTYTVTPVEAGYTFNPISTVVSVSGASVTGTNFVATTHPGSTYSISGKVTGAVQKNVLITLGLAGGTTTTDASGNYSFPPASLADGDYTVTPSLAGYTFTPANRSITLSGADSTGNDFTSAAVVIPTYSISGKVTLSGVALADVTINLTGATTASPTTNAGGNFSITGLYNGAYTVTPVKTGYTFTPSSSAVTLSGADVTNTNFVAAITPEHTYSISGTVSGAVFSDVTINLGGDKTGSTITNASGNYSLSGVANGNYTVTPSKTGYTFSPANAAANVSGADVTVPNFVATTAVPGPYSQADLTGTWRINNLKTGSDIGSSKWMRAMFSINSSGVATCLSMSDSGGATTCPSSLDWTLTMNSSTGVITQTGASNDAAGTDHMTMTSNKNFAAGTATSTGGGSNPRYQLTTMQKVVPGTSYSNADLQSKSFVYHQLMVGADLQWSRGDGTTDATGMLSIAHDISPSGDHGAQPNAGRFSVDASGTVTADTLTDFKGFLSADKKTIVGTQTEIKGTSTYYSFIIFQITGQTYTAGPLPVGISAAHMLACGSTPAPFWLHFTSTVASGGVMSFSNSVSSNSGVAAPGTTFTGHISASGTVTVAEDPSFHGQVSDDGKFTVATQTITSGAYALQVTTQ